MEFEVIKLLHIKQAITNSYSGKRYMIDKHFSCSFAETFSLVHFDNTVTGQRCYLRKILGNCNRVDVCIKITNGLCYSVGARKQFSMYSMEQPNLVPTHFLRESPRDEVGNSRQLSSSHSIAHRTPLLMDILMEHTWHWK